MRHPPISLLFFLFWFLTIIPTQETRASAATIRRSAGSPHGLRRNNPQEVHRLWELRREQFLFFQENVNKAMAAHVWDEQHRLLSHSFLRYLFLSWSVLLFLPRAQQGGRNAGPAGVHMVAEGTGGGEKSSLPLFVLGFYCLLLTLPPPPLQRSLLWMLPLEMWQEALDFCSFPDYTRMICILREFYFLLEQSLLELRIDTLFPSPALGGLWMASRDMQATFTRVLHLDFLVFG